MKKIDWIVLFLASIYVALLPLAPSSKFEYLLVALFLCIGIIYLAELALSQEKRKEFKSRFKSIILQEFSIIFILLVALMIVSALYSSNKIMTLKETLRFIYYLGIYFIIRFRFNNIKFFEVLIKVYMASAAVVSSIGFYSFVRHFKVGDSLAVILGTSRVRATFEHPNAYGVYLILAIFPAMIMFLRSNGKKKIKFLLLVALLSINIAVTFSRNAWLALVIGILLLVILYNWKYIVLYIIPGLFVLFIPSILGRVRQLLDNDINEGRIRLWKMSEKIITDHVIFGVGSGGFMTTYKEYAKQYPQFQIAEAEVLPPHNTYIKMFVELGIFGAMAFLLFCLSIVKRIFKVKEQCSGILKSFYDGYLVSVICFFIMNCFDDMFFVPKVTGGFIIFVSIAFTIGTFNVKEENKGPELEIS